MNLKRRLLSVNFTDKAKELLHAKELKTENTPVVQADELHNRQLPVQIEVHNGPKIDNLTKVATDKEVISENQSDDPWISVQNSSAVTPETLAQTILVAPNRSEQIIEHQDIYDDASPNVPQSSEEKKFEFYRIPTILSLMFMGASGNQFLDALKAGLSKAKQQADSFYESVFEGAVATNQSPINIEKAVECFHRAFNHSKEQRGNGDGFLQNMIWNLFSKTGGTPVVAELLERAKSELQDVSVLSKKQDEIVEQILGELKPLPGFESTFEHLKQKKEQRLELLKEKANREGRLTKEQALLFFPGSEFTLQNKSIFQQTLSNKPEGTYFVVIKGFGTAIDPKPGFFDACYRLGVSLDELKNIVFSSKQKLDATWFDEAEASFETRSSSEKVRIFAAAEVVESFSRELSKLEQGGCFDVIRFAPKVATLFGASESELFGGGFVTVKQNSITLKFVSEPGRVQIVQFADFGDNWMPESNDLFEKVDILVLSSGNLDGLFRSLAAVKKLCDEEKQPSLLVFDIPKTKPELLNLANSFKRYLNVPLAFASPFLVCDPENHRFLDAVKTFDSNDSGIWTDFISLASASSSSGEPFYFQDGKETDFKRNEADIIELLKIAQRCRLGLYFE